MSCRSIRVHRPLIQCIDPLRTQKCLRCSTHSSSSLSTTERSLSTSRLPPVGCIMLAFSSRRSIRPWGSLLISFDLVTSSLLAAYDLKSGIYLLHVVSLICRVEILLRVFLKLTRASATYFK